MGDWYWIRQGHTLGHFNVGTGCKYWITKVIELDNIVLERFYCVNDGEVFVFLTLYIEKAIKDFEAYILKGGPKDWGQNWQ